MGNLELASGDNIRPSWSEIPTTSAPGWGADILNRFIFSFGPLLSNRPDPTGGMKLNRTYRTPAHVLKFPPTVIARFGAASLVKRFDGPYELLGGTLEERAAAATEWCAMLAPQVVFASAPGGTKPAN